MKRKVAVLDHSPELISLVTPYKKSFVLDLKSRIPYPDRKWDPETKTWLISKAYLSEVLSLLNIHFPSQDIETNLYETNDYLEKLFSEIPPSMVDRVYKILAQCFHPDFKGDEDKMKKLNIVYERVKKG